MKNLIFILLAAISITLSACSKDEDQATKAIITVNDNQNTPVSGVVVYAYTQDTWQLFGDDSFYANKSVSTDNNGEAIFLLDDIINLFAFNNQETIYFSVHYTLGGNNKKKFTTLTFQEYQEKSATLIAN